MGVQNGFCCGKPTQPCHLEHLEPMSAKHLEEEPSSRKSKPWRLFQSLTCVIVTSNASELPWDDGDNKIVWWSTEVSSSNNCFIPYVMSVSWSMEALQIPACTVQDLWNKNVAKTAKTIQRPWKFTLWGRTSKLIIFSPQLKCRQNCEQKCGHLPSLPGVTPCS